MAERLGQYTLIRLLASGGMADVFLARDDAPRGLARHVVVKRVFPHLARDGQYLTMLLEEARLAAALKHANIVQVYEAGEHDGHYYIAMEHLHGHDLARLEVRLAETGQRMPLEQVLQIVIAVCAGLHHAHEQQGADGSPLGVVHRDVSPHNIFVTYDGHVKLVDFGIAKAAFRSHHTQTGVIRGKAGYLAPEQARGEVVDRRADVFALSVVLWELLTGKRLFVGDDPFVVMRKAIETDAPAPSSVCQDLPPRLDVILARGLAREREARYATAQALADDLEAVARQLGLVMSQRSLATLLSAVCPDEATPPHAESARPVPELATAEQRALPKPSRKKALIVATVAIAVTVLGAWGYVVSRPAPPVVIATAPPPVLAVPLAPAVVVDAHAEPPAPPQAAPAAEPRPSSPPPRTKTPVKPPKRTRATPTTAAVPANAPATSAASHEDRNAPILP